MYKYIIYIYMIELDASTSFVFFFKHSAACLCAQHAYHLTPSVYFVVSHAIPL